MSESANIVAVRALEDRRYAAAIAKDFTELEVLLAEECRYTHSYAAVDTKASFIDSLRSNALSYRDIIRHHEEYIDFGNAVLVSSRIGLELTTPTGDRSVAVQATIVWVHVGDGWQFITWQSTRLPD